MALRTPKIVVVPHVTLPCHCAAACRHAITTQTKLDRMLESVGRTMRAPLIRYQAQAYLLRTVRYLSVALVAIGTFFAPGKSSAEGERVVKSLLEMRRENVVVQKWDLSCGAAALTTVLNYQYGDPVTEQEVALALIDREEYLKLPQLVNIRHGFSLLDLKRYVDGRGYQGIGLGQMDLDDLIERAPVIVPIKTHGYNHFVVFRGVMGNRALLADPAWGNRTMLTDAFESAWIDYPEIGKVGFVVARADGLAPPGALRVRPDHFVSLR